MVLTPPGLPSAVLVVRTSGRVCALPVGQVAEVMRPLPVEPLPEAPEGVMGVAVVRGRASPVVDLGSLLGGGDGGRGEQARFVSVRLDGRLAVLLVDEVPGVRMLREGELEALPPLWRGSRPPAVAALGRLDRALLLVLEAGRLLPEGWSLSQRVEEGAP